MGSICLGFCIRGLKKIEVKTQNMETNMCKAKGGLPFSFYGYHSVSMILKTLETHWQDDTTN